jgi:flagellar biogenesis protein FliO
VTPAFWAAYAVKLAIVAIVLAALYALARLLRSARFFPRGDRCADVIETTALSPHAALHVVRFGGRRLLIGSAAGGVTRLADADDGVRPSTPAPRAGVYPERA